jgi:Coenzyme PQQ synthesis protein D (PqqD)
MRTQSRYRVNSPQVINETIDGEAVIINLATGDYFSLGGAGADIWQEIERMASVEDIVQSLGYRYDGDPQRFEQAVWSLIEQLQRHGLIVPADGIEPQDISPRSAAANSGSKMHFQEPTLETYTDMQDLILLDPVHEVDERGWPHPAPGVRTGESSR